MIAPRSIRVRFQKDWAARERRGRLDPDPRGRTLCRVRVTDPVGRHIVNLKRITCPVLNLMAAHDDLVPCAQSEPFNDLVASSDRKAIKLPAGHIGLAVGSRAQRELWPRTVEWLAERSETPAPARRRKRG